MNTTNTIRDLATAAKVNSFTTAGTVYIVALADTNVATCTCPDYRYRRAIKSDVCKHIAAVRRALSALRELDALGVHPVSAAQTAPVSLEDALQASLDQVASR